MISNFILGINHVSVRIELYKCPLVICMVGSREVLCFKIIEYSNGPTQPWRLSVELRNDENLDALLISIYNLNF